MPRAFQSVTSYAESVRLREKSTDDEFYQSVPRAVGAMPKSYPAGYPGSVHSHKRAQLLYAESGVMTFATSDHFWIVPPQRAVWIPPEKSHRTATLSSVEMRTLYIRSDACPAGFPQDVRLIHVSPLLRELILRATAMPVEYDEYGQDGKVIDLIFGEIEWSRNPDIQMTAFRDPKLARIQQEFAVNPGNERTLAQLAAEARVSSRTLARLFRSETGGSFRTWRHQMRALAALPRLALGHSVTDIAFDLGYETPGAFAAMFRKVMGAAPSRYFERVDQFPRTRQTPPTSRPRRQRKCVSK